MACSAESCWIEKKKKEAKKSTHTWDSLGGFSSSLSGAAPSDAPGRFSPVPIPRRLARFSSRLALRISTCASSRRRRSSSGLKVLFALNWVRRCSGMYRSAMVATGRRSTTGYGCGRLGGGGKRRGASWPGRRPAAEAPGRKVRVRRQTREIKNQESAGIRNRAVAASSKRADVGCSLARWSSVLREAAMEDGGMEGLRGRVLFGESGKNLATVPSGKSPSSAQSTASPQLSVHTGQWASLAPHPAWVRVSGGRALIGGQGRGGGPAWPVFDVSSRAQTTQHCLGPWGFLLAHETASRWRFAQAIPCSPLPRSPAKRVNPGRRAPGLSTALQPPAAGPDRTIKQPGHLHLQQQKAHTTSKKCFFRRLWDRACTAILRKKSIHSLLHGARHGCCNSPSPARPPSPRHLHPPQGHLRQ